jgi:hypothetical protein
MQNYNTLFPYLPLVRCFALSPPSPFSSLWHCGPMRATAASFLWFLDHTRCTTVGRTPLDKGSARRRDLYLATNNTHNRQTSMPLAGFEPTISAGERPQTYALDRAATGTGVFLINPHLLNSSRNILRGFDCIVMEWFDGQNASFWSENK